MVKQPQTIHVEVHTGLVGETPLILGDDLKSISSLYLMNQAAPTFAINTAGQICNSEILSVPKEVYVDTVIDIKFSNGLIITCAPGSIFRGINTWVNTKDLNVGDKVMGAMYTPDRGIIATEYTVDKKEERIKIVKSPIYLFIAKDQNILIPHVGVNDLTFICVKQ